MGCHISQQQKLIKESIRSTKITSIQNLNVPLQNDQSEKSGYTTSRNNENNLEIQNHVNQSNLEFESQQINIIESNEKIKHDDHNIKPLIGSAYDNKQISNQLEKELSEPKVAQLLNDNHDQYFTQDQLLHYEEKYKNQEENSDNLASKNDTKDIQWKKGEVIGVGSFGTVYMGLKADVGEIMAVKQIHFSAANHSPQSQNALKEIISEMEMLKKLQHKNIVRCIGTSHRDNTLYIFLEYVSGGSISSLLKQFGKFNEALIQNYTKQILQGLEYLHSHQVVHRDIKGANVLVDSKGVCKLADFGSAKAIVQQDQFKSLQGTANWMAPEVIKQTGYGRFSDIWSVGCTVIQMATGKPPFSNYNNPFQTMFHIAQITEPPELPPDLSSQAKDFLSICFRINPIERLNAAKLLKHSFITGQNNNSQQFNKHQILSPIIQQSENFLFSPMPNQIKNKDSNASVNQVNNQQNKQENLEIQNNKGKLLQDYKDLSNLQSGLPPIKENRQYDQAKKTKKSNGEGLLSPEKLYFDNNKQFENKAGVFDFNQEEDEENSKLSDNSVFANLKNNQFTFKTGLFVDDDASNSNNDGSLCSPNKISNFLVDQNLNSKTSQQSNRKNFVKKNSLSSQSSLYQEAIKQESIEQSHSQMDCSQILQVVHEEEENQTKILNISSNREVKEILSNSLQANSTKDSSDKQLFDTGKSDEIVQKQTKSLDINPINKEVLIQELNISPTKCESDDGSTPKPTLQNKITNELLNNQNETNNNSNNKISFENHSEISINQIENIDDGIHKTADKQDSSEKKNQRKSSENQSNQNSKMFFVSDQLEYYTEIGNDLSQKSKELQGKINNNNAQLNLVSNLEQNQNQNLSYNNQINKDGNPNSFIDDTLNKPASQNQIQENENLWGRESDQFGQDDNHNIRQKSFQRFPLKENVYQQDMIKGDI